MDTQSLRSRLEPIFRRHDSVMLAYVIGSVARGDTHGRSDIDLAVLMRDRSVGAYKALWADLHDALAPTPFDLADLHEGDPVFAFVVISEGVPIFYRSVDELNSFERNAWNRFQDTRRLRAIGDSYLAARSKAWSSGKT